MDQEDFKSLKISVTTFIPGNLALRTDSWQCLPSVHQLHFTKLAMF